MIAYHGSKGVYLKEDLIPRLERAVKSLDLLIRHESWSEQEKVRLQGKLEGVQLALSYAREGLRV